MTVGLPAPAIADRWFIERLASRDLLREAWSRVQRGGKTAGVDGVTVSAYRSQADRRLAALGEAVLHRSYVPAAVKRVQIPKPTGGWRALGIPTVTDRVVQTAAALALHDRIATLFSDRSFAYRPFLGPRRAALFLRNAMTPALWAVTADIEKFFDNVDHGVLSGQLRGVGIDSEAIRLVMQWLTAPVQDGPRRLQPVKGLPQGSPIAPLLANLYLTGFDTALEGERFTHVRYADDFVILTGNQEEGQRALRFVAAYLEGRLKLRVKTTKTQLGPVSNGFEFVGFRFAGDEWTIPGPSLDRFRESVGAGLQGSDARQLASAAVAHNNIVRGWRNYFSGNSAEMDRQLAALDAWRIAECRTHLARCGLDPDSAVVWFERLLEEPEETSPPGVYAHTEQVQRRDIAENPVDAGAWHGPVALRTPAGRATMRTSQAVRDAVIGHQQEPILSGRWLRIPTFGAFVAKSRQLITVRRKKQVIFECAIRDLSCLTIEADGVVLSSRVIEECCRRGIPIAVCRLSGRPVARIVAARSPLSVTVVRRQLAARAGRRGVPLVTEIIGAKLANQRALLLYHAKYKNRHGATRIALKAAAAQIALHLDRLSSLHGQPMHAARTSLFLEEAKAAAHYWQAVRLALPASLGFRRRQHREATDVVNKALSYGYALLLNRVWVAVHRAGFEPTLGLLHTGRRQSMGLVYDLMEPFRQPVVDRAVLGLVGRGASLELNGDGDLTIRTRRLIQRAVGRRLDRGNDRRTPALIDIHRHALAFRRALVSGTDFRAYRMTW